MEQVFGFFFAAWPLIVVAALVIVMMRSARRPKRHDVRSGGDHADHSDLRGGARRGRADDHGDGGGDSGSGD